MWLSSQHIMTKLFGCASDNTLTLKGKWLTFVVFYFKVPKAQIIAHPMLYHDPIMKLSAINQVLGYDEKKLLKKLRTWRN
jgi:hypothetical protein